MPESVLSLASGLESRGGGGRRNCLFATKSTNLVPVFASLFEQQQPEASVFFFAVFFSVESGCQCVIEILSIGEHLRCCRSLLLAYIPQLRWPTTGITRELSEILTRRGRAGRLPRNCER